MRRATLALLVLALAAGLAGRDGLPREVVKCPRPEDTLASRKDWAQAEAARAGYKDGFWVGWSVRRLMDENSHIGSFSTGRSPEVTLEELLTGKKFVAAPVDREIIRRTAREILDGLEKPAKEERKVWKDIALLSRYGAGPRPALENVRMSEVRLEVDLDDRPLLWLGGASDGESIETLKKAFGGAPAGKVKEHLVAAVGILGSPGLVLPFLEEVLKSGEADGVRKDAAFWISQQDAPSVLPILSRTARTDRSPEVRESAVFGVSQVESPESVDELIALARGAESDRVRKEAVFWLGQKASKKAGEALVSFAYDDRDLKVREQAVFALSELPDNQGVEPLIKIARTHPDPRIRKKAVFWLGECDDPRALEMLIEIVKGKSAPGA
jgi:hypothetical protein